MRPVLRNLTCDGMEALLGDAGFDAYRGRQLYHWVFARGVGSLDAIGNLPKDLLDWLRAHTDLGALRLERVDGEPGGVRKLLFRLDDGCHIESVLMPDGPVAGRASLCVSSQVGCTLGCRFCLTGLGGCRRNLTTAEIVGQVLDARQLLGEDGPTLGHVVFMGMGEPLLNLDAVIGALGLLTDPDGVKLSRRRVTVSTAGVVPGLERLGREWPGVGLAVSLNAADDATRDALMPLNRQWPLDALMTTLRAWPIEPRRRITIEYVLLDGVNDAPDDADRLARLLRGLQCKINLIVYNDDPRLPDRASGEVAIERFAERLARAHYTVTVRRSQGREIHAACGQLAAHLDDAPATDA